MGVWVLQMTDALYHGIARAFCFGFLSAASVLLVPAKEFLTEQEIAKIQEATDIDKRVKIYLEAAALRLKTVEDRLYGRESPAGDPLEFFSIEDMLDGYYRIIRSVMFNVDDAFQNATVDRAKLNKALKVLKDSTEKATKDLIILKKIAEEKKKEEAWDLIQRAQEITEGAHDGAETGLARFPGKSKPKS